jgi:hypothetical protein
MLFSFLFGCNAKQLTNEEAKNLIREKVGYPKVWPYEIYRADAAEATRFLNAGLERDGWLRVLRTQKLGDMGKPLVFFDDKAAKYFLPTPIKDTAKLQIVRIADMDVDQITAIKVEQNSAKVEYTMVYKNISPFAVLLNKPINATQRHYACFELFDNGWRVVECGNATR